MKQIVFIADQKLESVIHADGEASSLEKSIFEQISSHKAASKGV